MSKISTALRAAALGPAPLFVDLVTGWLGKHAQAFLQWREVDYDDFFFELTEVEKRMVMLFVAEAEAEE